VSKFNPDVRNICLVDVIALRTPSVVVSPDPMGLNKTMLEPYKEGGRKMVNVSKAKQTAI